MEIVLLPMLLALAGLVLLIVAQIWLGKVERLIATGLAVTALVTGLWIFKNLERDYEKHFILRDAGGILTMIEMKLESGDEAEVRALLKKHGEKVSLLHLSVMELSAIQPELWR